MAEENHVEVAEQFTLHLLGDLCEHINDLKIESTIDERGVFIKVLANEADLGRLIGKKGETINAVRTLLRALGSKHQARYSLKIDSANSIVKE